MELAPNSIIRDYELSFEPLSFKIDWKK